MPVFVDQMKRLDKTLFIKLDKSIERFVVYRRDRKSYPRLILVIEDDKGQFCYPNRCHIDKLYRMDTWQNRDFVSEMDAHNDNLDRESSDHVHRLSEEMSKIATRTRFY